MTALEPSRPNRRTYYLKKYSQRRSECERAKLYNYFDFWFGETAYSLANIQNVTCDLWRRRAPPTPKSPTYYKCLVVSGEWLVKRIELNYIFFFREKTGWIYYQTRTRPKLLTAHRSLLTVYVLCLPAERSAYKINDTLAPTKSPMIIPSTIRFTPILLLLCPENIF